MAPATSTRMDARDALHLIADLPRYEERLAARTAGLTFMVWGIAIAGLFMTYTAAGEVLERNDASWAFSLLWIPWIAAGSASTATLWTSHAVTLRRDPETGSGIRMSVLVTLLFLVVSGALFVGLDVLGGVEWTVHSIMAAANGACAIILGTWQRKAWGAGARHLAAAGLAILAAAVAIGLSDLGNDASGLLAATVVGTAWFVAGILTYRAG